MFEVTFWLPYLKTRFLSCLWLFLQPVTEEEINDQKKLFKTFAQHDS